MKLHVDSELRQRLERVNLGQEPPDIILLGGTVLNVYTGELLKGCQVVIAGDRIAYVGADKDFQEGLQTRIIDVGGNYIIPGLIDSHCHMELWMGLPEYTRLSLPGGTTTVITECAAVANVMGIAGVRCFLNQLDKYPLRFFSTAPVITLLCALRGKRPAITVEEMLEILDCPEILGLGEIYWSKLMDGKTPEGIDKLIARSRALGKTIEGHSAGAKDRKLSALVSLGVESCHESISAGDVQERLRFGLSTMIREGSVRRELEAVIPPLVNMNLDLRKAILVSDGVWPNHLVRYGHMDGIVNKAVSLGLDPVTAIQMATLNAAEHFHLDDDLGGIAPGKYADLVVTPDLSPIDAQLVICRGRVVARKRQLLEELLCDGYPPEFRSTCKLPVVDQYFFRVECGGPEPKVRVMELVNDIVNRAAVLTLPASNGAVQIEPDSDVLKIAAIDRFEGDGRRFIGFIKGYGLRQGAVAASFSFDDANVVVIGSNDVDMALAVNRLRELNGGIVFCCCGRTVEEIPLPVFGTASDLAGEEAARRQDSMIAALKEMGCRSSNPILTLLTASFSAIPSLRISIRGYWLSKENRIIDLFV